MLEIGVIPWGGSTMKPLSPNYKFVEIQEDAVDGLRRRRMIVISRNDT